MRTVRQHNLLGVKEISEEEFRRLARDKWWDSCDKNKNYPTLEVMVQRACDSGWKHEIVEKET